MSLKIRFLALALIFTAAALDAARFSGEKGSRHRTRLAAGAYHTCALLDDGSVQCWGSNFGGQLGTNNVSQSTTPITVPNVSSAISLAAGMNHTCAIVSGGAVRCWGANNLGQLGNGTNSPAYWNPPVAVTGLTNVVSIAAGADHTCAVRVDGTLWCWGEWWTSNSSEFFSTAPQQNTSLSGVTSVAIGGKHTCALLANGTVKCFGNNTSGQLGTGNTIGGNVPPLTAPLSANAGVGAVDLLAGFDFTCARLSDGSVSCWGADSFGQLGNGNSTQIVPSPVPVSVAPKVVALTAGGEHSCVILVDGTVSCWGSDDLGVLGDGGSGLTPRSVPGPPLPTITNAVEIATGFFHGCAALVDGTIRCWGDNTYGQHGDGSTGQVGIVSVVGINGTFLGRGVAAGNQFTCGRRGTSAAACWGAGAQGQLGNSASTSSTNAVAVTGLASTIAVSAGNSAHACALDAGGSARCWGDNSRGQLGNGTTSSSNQPVLVWGGPFVSISAGDLHTCAVTVTGTIQCWGAGGRGQLGNGGFGDSSLPVPAFGIQNAVSVAAGNSFTCAVLVDATLRCWGDNTQNQLGDGGVETGTSAPKQVPGLVNILAVTTGANHACALSAFGTVLCWGANGKGQLGNNTITPAKFPTTVEGITDAVSLSAGAYFTCATEGNGDASCWGANDSGELSAIDSLDHLTPTHVGRFVLCGLLCPGGRAFFPIGPVVEITTGTSPSLPTQEHACALFASGVIDCWGDNSQGEIGNGTTTNASRPTAVNSFLANVDPAGTLRNDRIAEVTALVNCDPGDQAHIILTLEQGGSTGTGHAEAQCDGRLLQVPMNVPAQGPSGFQAGTATAHVEAIVRSEGAILDDTHWTKSVVLSVAK